MDSHNGMQPKIERYPHGVKKRMDGEGDGWANAHREKLAAEAVMTDIDGWMGMNAYCMNTGSQLFCEYTIDQKTLHPNHTARCAIVGFFDRKIRKSARLFGSQPHQVYMHIAQCIAVQQKFPPKFFYVFGSVMGPWEMCEVDIYTGEYTGEPFHCDTREASWKHMWDQCGLTALRRELEMLVHEKFGTAPVPTQRAAAGGEIVLYPRRPTP